jgi:hypothetical protein
MAFYHFLQSMGYVIFKFRQICPVSAIADCGDRLFDNHHGQFVNDGSAMVFLWLRFGLLITTL